MTTANGTHPAQTEARDWIFAQYGEGRSYGFLHGKGQKLGLPLTDVETPPPIQNKDDLRAANEWLRRERERLQEYTEMHLARIQNEQQALVRQDSLNEERMILACQELSCKEEMLSRQGRAHAEQQAAELSERERALASRLEQQAGQPENEAAQQQSLVQNLRDEINALQKTREATQAELEAMTRTLDEQRQTRNRERALMREQQDQMEKRLRQLDRAEQAAQRRLAELDELEVRLRDEFEAQERQLAEERRDLAAMSTRLRQHPPQGNGTPHERVGGADR